MLLSRNGNNFHVFLSSILSEDTQQRLSLGGKNRRQRNNFPHFVCQVLFCQTLDKDQAVKCANEGHVGGSLWSHLVCPVFYSSQAECSLFVMYFFHTQHKPTLRSIVLYAEFCAIHAQKTWHMSSACVLTLGEQQNTCITGFFLQ